MPMSRIPTFPSAPRSSAATARSLPDATLKMPPLGSTICAERTAACKAVSEGHRDFVRIAVYGDGEHYCYPCGACRQFLAEFAPDMEVLSAMGGGRYVSNRLSELMPYTFNY